MDISATRVLIGNGISVIACIVLAVSGYVKSKDLTLILQTIQMGLCAVVCIVLGAGGAAVVNILCVPRNILAQKDKLNIPAKVILCLLIGVLSVVFNQRGVIGFIPVIPTIIYTIYMDKLDKDKFKFLVIFMMVFWTIHDFLIQSYVTTVFNVISIITSAVAIYRIRKDMKAEDINAGDQMKSDQ